MNEPAPGLRYDPDLVEAAVECVLQSRLAGGDGGPFERYRQSADRIYGLYDRLEDRRQGFALLFARLFEELGCGKPLEEAVRGFAGRITEALVTRAWRPSEEGVELSADRRLLGLRLLPSRFATLSTLEILLLHECGHVEDMLDERFGYGQGLTETTGRIPGLTGKRFGFLWDCAVDGRIRLAGKTPARNMEELAEEGLRLFHALPREALAVVVRRLGEERPTYGSLLAWAGNPAVLAAWAGVAGDLRGEAPEPRLGDPCPLCGFPTHDWADAIPSPIAGLVQADFPTWQPEAGACGRCLEAYALSASARPVLQPIAGEVGS